jgi:CheY-like chemotaxis protein
MQQDAGAKCGRVLVSQTEEPLRSLCSSVLETAGHEVRGCRDADETLTLAREWAPDVIVTDLLKPGGPERGVEMIRRLKADDQTKGIAVVVVAQPRSNPVYGYLARDALEAGALYHVEIPLAPQVLTETAAWAVTLTVPPGVQRKRIIHSDDFVDFCIATRIFLETEGYEVRSAYTADKTLELVTSWPPDLIITDILKPGMDGLEMIRRLKADPTTAGIPVMVVSATLREPGLEWIGQTARALGVRVLVPLPICDFPEFARTVAEALQSEPEGR